VSAVVTSGVLLEYDKYYVLQTGMNRARDALGVVRLGGHVEPGEDPTQCALREVREEACTDAEIAPADTAYSYEPDGETFRLTPFRAGLPPPSPLLIASMAPAPGVSVTYLAHTRDRPTPGAETQALIFLTLDDVRWITADAVTLGDFLAAGGIVDDAVELPRDLRLRPHGQLLALSQLVRLELVRPFSSG
jgi:8-oxo-dGTP pyrophosphatase MutT (NUDIX family)